MKLQNKVAVITGGSSGIGLATAWRFIAEGARVFITGRRQSELDQAKTQLGSNVTAVQGDVADLDDLDRLYRTVASSRRREDPEARRREEFPIPISGGVASNGDSI
jgi:NAD(P)-dependent dehydrogenase (short-subunit alcohol dehydrogenase family)